MGKALYEWCIEKQEHTLLAQWDTERNDGLSPHDVSFGSHRKLWWSCENGHHWQAAVYARTGGSGCPFCTRRRPWIGKNDLASQNPELTLQWHPTKNVGLAPSQVAANSHKSVWWVCEKGHEWRAQIRGRVNGCGCPVCANRILMPGENDLAATHPELSRQWHPTKNGTLTPGDLMAGTARKVWWECPNGHVWKATIASRARGRKCGCPVCAGKVKESRQLRYASMTAEGFQANVVNGEGRN